MNPLFILFNFFLLLPNYKVSQINPATECQVKDFFEAVELDYGTKVLTTYGNIEEAELVLIPTKIDEGVYEISITRKSSNLYKLEGTSIYVQTNYCYEYATYEDAILKVESNYGYNRGTLVFD